MSELFTNFIAILIWVAIGIGAILFLGSIQHNNNAPQQDCGGDVCQTNISDEQFGWDN